MAAVEPVAGLVVDAANVVGSRPDGWWRDRAGAAARLVDALAGALRAGTLAGPVTVVLEGAARAGAPVGPLPVPTLPGALPNPGPLAELRILHAEADGDSTIVELVHTLVADGAEPAVVTADRALRARVISAGATVLPPSWLLTRL